MQGLSEREHLVLNALIERHVQTAEPVSSQELCEYFGFQWSSATIRNVLAGLEEKGFLNHPYTSSGKNPTVKAYKYLVETLWQSQPNLGREEQNRVFDILHEVRETDKLVKLTAKVLAVASRLLAVTWVPNQSSEKLERVQIIRLSARRIMLIVHTLSGHEFQNVVDLEDNTGLLLLEQAIRLVNEWGHGRTPEELGRLAQTDWPGLDRRMTQLIKHALTWVKSSMQVPVSEAVVIEGAANLIGQPEFNDIQATRELVLLLDQRDRLVQSLQNPGIRCQRVRVVIGEEGWPKHFPALSLVVEEIVLPDNRTMQLGVIGPSRMAYERIIPLVQEAALAFSHAIEQ